MSFVLFKDSFDRYGVGGVSGSIFDNMAARYTAVSGSGLEIITGGRNGQAISIGTGAISKTLEHSDRWVTGFAVKCLGISSGTNRMYTINNNTDVLFTLIHDEDGTLSMRAGTNLSESFAVTTRALHVDRTYDIEVDVTFSGAAPIVCTAELRINGKVEASGSHNTAHNSADLLSGDATGNYHTWVNGMGGVGSGMVYDDLYVKNEAGYEGDVRVTPIYADGDGGTLDWTPNSGSVHFDRVNTHPLDVTKFLETANIGDIDLWTFTLPAVAGSIVGINISVAARKDDEGTKSFKIVFGATGTDAESDEFFVSSVTAEYYEWGLKEDPSTSMPFASAGVITVGVKLIS